MTKTINVTLSAYEGDNFPNADDLFEDFVLGALTATFPDAKISISTAKGRTRVFVDSVPDQDLAQEIANDWWVTFCETVRAPAHASHADTMTAWCTPPGQLPLDVAARERNLAAWTAADEETAKVTGHTLGCDCTECCLVRTEAARAMGAK